MHTKMNPEIKALWIADLIENAHLQGKGCLRRTTPEGDEFCCLGRLSELAVLAGVIPPPEHRDHNAIDRDAWTYRDPQNMESRTASLLDAVAIWAGLHETDRGWDAPEPNSGGSFDRGGFGGTDSLSSMNDSDSTFVEIATTIEHYF